MSYDIVFLFMSKMRFVKKKQKEQTIFLIVNIIKLSIKLH